MHSRNSNYNFDPRFQTDNFHNSQNIPPVSPVNSAIERGQASSVSSMTSLASSAFAFNKKMKEKQLRAQAIYAQNNNNQVVTPQHQPRLGTRSTARSRASH